VLFIVAGGGPFFYPKPRFFPADPLLSGGGGALIMTAAIGLTPEGRDGSKTMSIDKSLRRKNQLARSRNVLTRGERIKVLMDEERWKEGRGPYGLPKVRVLKIAAKKGKAKKEEAAAAPEEGAAETAAEKK
jgi:small basic protein (TIGR04137 family)